MTTFTYRLSATGKCPVDGTYNTYAFEIGADTPIMAEDIAGVVKAAFAAPTTQEGATRFVRGRVHGSVRSKGVHVVRLGPGDYHRVEIEVFER